MNSLNDDVKAERAAEFLRAAENRRKRLQQSEAELPRTSEDEDRRSPS
jgi:hypothetical protein